MLLENTAAGKLIDIHDHEQGGTYYDIIATSTLPGNPFPAHSVNSTEEDFLIHYEMPYLNFIGRDTHASSDVRHSQLKPEDVTHIAISIDGLRPQLEAIKFCGQWLKSGS